MNKNHWGKKEKAQIICCFINNLSKIIGAISSLIIALAILWR